VQRLPGRPRLRGVHDTSPGGTACFGPGGKTTRAATLRQSAEV
jgi:hypothetical protein